jgi:hypothetical protein
VKTKKNKKSGTPLKSVPVNLTNLKSIGYYRNSAFKGVYNTHRKSQKIKMNKK